MTLKKFTFPTRPIDIFAMVNIGLFLIMCYGTYFDRFVRYRGSAYLPEFFVYALVIIALILFAWKKVRHLEVPGWLLLMVQLGLFMHFAGGLTFVGDKRLYDAVIMGVRYDKYVHLFNAAAAGLLVQRLPLTRALKHEWLAALATILIVLGLGAFVEIIEYLVMLTIPLNGVGNYDNNMLDLIFNLIGVSLSIFLVKVVRRMVTRKDLQII